MQASYRRYTGKYFLVWKDETFKNDSFYCDHIIAVSDVSFARNRNSFEQSGRKTKGLASTVVQYFLKQNNVKNKFEGNRNKSNPCKGSCLDVVVV